MKTSKKLLSLSLSAALVFTTVFAGAESIFAETSVTEKDCPAPLELAENCTLDFENAETAGAVKATGVNASLQAMTEMQSVTAVNINTTTEANAYKTGLYDRNNLWSIPVKIPAAGNFLINLVSTGNNNVYLFDTPNPGADTKPIAAMALPASPERQRYIFLLRPCCKKQALTIWYLQPDSYSKDSDCPAGLLCKGSEIRRLYSSDLRQSSLCLCIRHRLSLFQNYRTGHQVSENRHSVGRRRSGCRIQNQADELL